MTIVSRTSGVRTRQLHLERTVVPSRLHHFDSLNPEDVLQRKEQIRLPFQFHDVCWNGKAMGQAEIEQYAYVVQAEDAMEMTFEVDKILDTAVVPYTTLPVPPGEYATIVNISLRAAADFNVARWLQSNLIPVSFVNEALQ